MPSPRVVTVQLDPENADLALTVDLPEAGATVRWVKEELCRQDPTGETVPGSIRLRSAAGGPGVLDDGASITAELAQLVLLPSGNGEEAKEEAQAQQKDPAKPAAAPPAQEPAGASAEASKVTSAGKDGDEPATGRCTETATPVVEQRSAPEKGSGGANAEAKEDPEDGSGTALEAGASAFDYGGSAAAAGDEDDLQFNVAGDSAAASGLAAGAAKREDLAAKPPALAVGVRVEIVGLKSRADLNGRRAELLLLDEATGRWECRIAEAACKEIVRCKPDNLVALSPAGAYDEGDDEPPGFVPPAEGAAEPAAAAMPRENAGPLRVGARVEIQDLKSRADLNGRAAEVVKQDTAAGRWEVKVETTGQSIRCKPENLLVLPGMPDCAFKREGDDAFKSNHLKKAIDCYRKSLDAHSDDTEFQGVLRSNMSAVWTKQGDHQKALEEATEAIRLRPKWSRGHARYALALFNLERFVEADKAYAQAVALEPVNESNLAGLASVAAKLAGTALNLGPARHKQLGNDALKAGNAAGAVVHYTRAVGCAGTVDAEDAAAFHSNRSAAFAQLAAWGLALRDGQAAVGKKPSWPKAHVRVGSALLGMNQYEEAYKSLAYALGLCPGGYLEAKRNLNVALWRFPLYTSPTSKRRLKRFDEDAEKPDGHCRVFAISDVHIDHTEAHKRWAEGLSKTEYKNDVLIIAGDLGDTLRSIKIGLKIFKSKFRRVFYTPGNHDMWLRQDTSDKSISDSVAKLVSMFDVCEEIGAEMLPARVMKGVYVVPLLSWYNYQFCTPDPTPSDKIFDSVCKWPMEHDDVWKWFIRLNDHGINKVVEAQREHGRGDVISFSHFLPRYDLPWPGVMGMVKASGCKELEAQVRAIQSRVHIFGHSHINIQRTIDGIVYTQFSLNDPNYGFAPQCPLLLLNVGGQPVMRMHTVY